MPHWLIKSAVQRGISWLPGTHFWNTMFQKYVTRSLELTPERFLIRLEYCRKHFEHLLEARPDCASGFTAMEIGTGWYPVVPIGLFLCGATRIDTFDISPLLHPDRLRRVLEELVALGKNGALRQQLPRFKQDRMERLEALVPTAGSRKPEALLGEMNIHSHVRGAQDTQLPAASVDLFTSTGVLEYIPRPVLRAILAECRRIGTRNATQSHYLNLVDQFWYFDRSITPINFLRYTDRQWKYFNSPLTWQNRLRICDYRALLEEAGYRIVAEANESAPKSDLERIQLAPEFRHYREEDLLVTISWLVAQPREV